MKNCKWCFLGPSSCKPYSKNACEDAADRLGLQKGAGDYTFVGDYNIKGCYAYKEDHDEYPNMAFYGIAGTEDQIIDQPAAPAYRPTGYDCSSMRRFQIITEYKSFASLIKFSYQINTLQHLERIYFCYCRELCS